jgi:hypothetical protein
LSKNADKLYQLLPAIYRIRDSENGEVLKAFMAVLAQQADVVDEDIANLYDNWFIETCDEWVVPYIGNLLEVRNLHPISEKAMFSQRARVANTLGYRRRKGTASMLEQLAHDTTGWDARAVEFFKLLDTTQYINHIRLDNHRSPDIRDGEKLELLDTPFDTVAHTGEVRHIENMRGQYNILNIGIYLWRLQAYPVREAPAFAHNPGQFSFSQLGNDIRLFNHPLTEQNPTHLASEVNVPEPIRSRAFFSLKELYYGKDKSLYIRADGRDITSDEIVPCNLSEWKHLPPDGMVAVDPVLGRIAFSAGVAPSDVQVTYYYGFSSEVGGGFYDRRTIITQNAEGIRQYDIGKSLTIKTIKDAISSWKADGSPNAVFSIKDSQIYDENLKLEFIIPPGITLEIRADNEERPVLRLTDPITIKGEAAGKDQPGGKMIIDGLLIAGSYLKILDGDLGSLQLLHSTLVPGIDLNTDSTPKSGGQESITVEKGNLRLDTTINRSITGGLALESTDRLSIKDSIIDGVDGFAIKGPSVVIEESTILGSVSVMSVSLGSNSIFTGKVIAERIQEGCMRFSYFPKDSEVPRQYRCQPDTAIQNAVKKELDVALVNNPGMTPQEQKQLEEKIRKQFEKEIPVRLKPVFTDLHYGHPGYAQLYLQCPVEIREGAEDEAEMGVFHHLQQPQREANLRASLEEYMRVGLEAGIFYVT